MGKTFRVILLIAVLLGTIGLAQRQVAWAGSSAEDEQSAQLQSLSLDSLPDVAGGHEDDGTVKPPHRKVLVCKKGTYSIGGVAVLKVKRLAPHYCVLAYLRKPKHVFGKVPSGAGTILADVTQFQVIYKNRFVGSLPDYAGHVELSYAVPPGKEAKLYYLDGWKRIWKALSTSVKKNAATARIWSSTSYALIGK